MAKNVVPWLWRSKTVPLGKDENSVQALQRQINRLFNDYVAGSSLIPEFVSEPLVQLGERLSSFVPNVDVARTESALVVTVEAPGMDERDIELSLTHDGLTIRGERKPPQLESEEGAWLYVESTFGSFERIVPLAEVEVVEDAIEATAKNGIVTIVLPIKHRTSPPAKKLSIRSAE